MSEVRCNKCGSVVEPMVSGYPVKFSSSGIEMEYYLCDSCFTEIINAENAVVLDFANEEEDICDDNSQKI